MNDEILVAGGTGIVGANLTKKLRQEGRNVVSTRFMNKDQIFKNCLSYDFRNYSDCLESTKDKSAVVICAGAYHGVKKKDSNIERLLPNLKINLGLLEASVQNKVKTIILLSTSVIYQNAFYAIREDELNLNLPPFESYFGNGWTFRYIEKIASYYAKKSGIRIVLLRPTNIYGPFDNFDEKRSHVIPAIIKRILSDEDPLVAWGNPYVVRDFLFVDDFVADIIEAIDNPNIPSGDPINICNGVPLTIEEAINIIADKCNKKLKIVFDTTKPSSIPFRALNNSKYKVYFGNKRRTAFHEGVKITIEWYKNTYK